LLSNGAGVGSAERTEDAPTLAAFAGTLAGEPAAFFGCVLGREVDEGMEESIFMVCTCYRFGACVT
jgi:hypothetical protein